MSVSRLFGVLLAGLSLLGSGKVEIRSVAPPASAASQQETDRPWPIRRFRWSRQAQQDRAGFYYQPAGLCEDYPTESRTSEKLRRDFETLRRTGAQLLRVGISWLDVESAPGKYDWRFWDLLASTAQRAKITLIPYVCYTPEWIAQRADNFWRQPPRDPGAFGRFMETIARRYKGRIHSWELWNEPDNPDFWLGSPDQYAQMVLEGARGVRRADPDAVVVLGGFSAGEIPFDTLQSRYSICRDVDVLNMHGYAETWSNDRMEDYPYHIATLSAKVETAKPRPDLWLAEFGYSNYRATQNSTSNGGGSEIFFDYEHTLGYQAVALFKAHVLALSTGRLALTAWYRINDLKPSAGVIGDDNNKYLGIVDLQGRPKPAFFALRFYNRLFDQPTKSIDSAVAVQAPTPTQSEVHVFEKKNGDVLVTGWLRRPRHGEIADTSGMAKDTRREAVNITLPRRDLALQAAYDAQGNRMPAAAVWQAPTLSNVVLTGRNLFIVELKRRRQSSL